MEPVEISSKNWHLQIPLASTNDVERTQKTIFWIFLLFFLKIWCISGLAELYQNFDLPESVMEELEFKAFEFEVYEFLQLKVSKV